LSELSKQVTDARAKTETLRAQVEQIDRLHRSGVAVDSTSEVLQSSVIAKLREQESTLVQRAAELQSELGPRHPAIAAVGTQLTKVRQLIGTELQRIVMSVNALMALYEFATRTLTFPYRFDGEVFPFDLRSSALQGHPLTNAMVTTCYLLALMSGAKTVPGPLKAALILLQFAALVTFGSRAATVVTLALSTIYCLIIAHRKLPMQAPQIRKRWYRALLLKCRPIIVRSRCRKLTRQRKPRPCIDPASQTKHRPFSRCSIVENPCAAQSNGHESL